MKTRIKSSLASSNPFQRFWHFLFGGILYRLPISTRKWLYDGNRHYCPICFSHLRKFLVLHRNYNLICPVCRSLQRHRLSWLLINQVGLLDKLPKKMLHIAPEQSLSSRFLDVSGLEYISIDLSDSSAMSKMDITALEFLENTFDIIYCSHVLEHVPDDHRAIEEIWRVLKVNGFALIMVPITADHTYEDLSVTDPLERERLFGQHDHLRRYGPDFIQRLENAGFKSTMYEAKNIVNADEIAQQGLPEFEYIYLCKK